MMRYEVIGPEVALRTVELVLGDVLARIDQNRRPN